MPALQTSYTQSHARWVEGMILNSEPSDIISRIVESAAGIGFGKVACQGASDNGIIVPAANKVYRGITVLDPTQVGGTVDTYAQYATAAVMTKGVIVAQASVAVAAGDKVYFVAATGALTNTDNSSANPQIPNAIWETSTSGAGLAAIRLG